MKTSRFINRFLQLSVLILTCILFFSCKPKQAVVLVPADYYSLSEAEYLYQDKKLEVFLLNRENFNPEEYKKVKILAQLEVFSGDENKEKIADSDLLISTILYPCVPFEENMKQVVSSDLDNNSVKLYKFNEIPEQYVALPVSDSDKLLAPINDAIYPDSEKYPFKENFYSKITYSDYKEIKLSEKLFNAGKEVTDQWYKEKFLPQNTNIQKSDLVFVASCGDIMIARGVEDKMIADEKPDAIFNDTLDVLKPNDITIGNLEGVVTTRTKNAVKTYTFKFKKAALQYLKDAGFDYFMITNNHSYDYGEDGFKDTLAALKEYDFKTSGAGLNYNEAAKFYNQIVNGQNIAILSVGAYPVEQSGFNGQKTATAQEKRAGVLWKSDKVFELIREEKAKGNFVIVNSHAGNEYVLKPSAAQRSFYEEMCDNGADVIFGSHPHVLQPIEMYNNSLIVWSLGNFIFNGMSEMAHAEDTMIVRVGIVQGRVLYYQKYEAKINDRIVKLKNNNQE